MLDKEMNHLKGGINEKNLEAMNEEIIEERDSVVNESDLMNENGAENNHIDDIVKIVMRKFNSSAKL